MANTTTLDDLLGLFYWVLKENELDSTAYPRKLAVSLINWAQSSICSGSVTDLTNSEKNKLEKWPLPFLFKDKYYSSVLDGTLDADTTVWATSLSIPTTTDFLDSWNLWINEDIIQYTAKTAASVTWVTGVDFAHKGWSNVAQLFDLPTDYATANRIIYDNRVVLSNKDYRDVFLQLNNYKSNIWYNYNNWNNIDWYNQSWIPSFYTIIQGLYLLPFQINVTWNMIHMIYEKKATKLVDWTDVCTIPDEWSEQTIPLIAAWEILYYRWEEARWLAILAFAYWKIMWMYDYYMNQNNESLHGQRITTAQDSVLNI